MDGPEKPQRVAVCIASYRRRQGLQALFGGLDAQCFEGERPEIVLVVADNDAAESASPAWRTVAFRANEMPLRGSTT